MSKFLKANGKTLRDNFGTGDVVTLRGTNAGGWLVQENWMCPTNAKDQKTMISTLTNRFDAAAKDWLIQIYEDNWWTTADFENAKNLGMNVLRLPFWYVDIIDDNGNLKSNAWTRLDWFVDNCNARNIYVILDMHGAPGSQQGADHSGDTSGAHLWDSPANMDKTVWIWQQIAAHFKGNATVAGYDLLNEPTAASGSTQWDFYDRMYKAIRAIDPDHVIIIEATWNANDLPNPSQYGWVNVMYSYHAYCWNADNDYNKQKSFTDEKVNMVNSANYNVPTFIGEFTGFTNSGSWDYILKTYNQQGWSWTTWTYKVTGSNNNWGLYNGNPQKVDIYGDSASTIESKWSGMRNAFTQNTALVNIFSKYVRDNTGTPVIFNNFDTNQGYSAGGNAIVTYNSSGKNVKLTTSASSDPGNENQCVKIVPQTGSFVDASTYGYFTLWIDDTQGNNTVKVTMIDTGNAVWSGWTAIASKQNTWVGISLPMSSVTGINKGAIKEIRLGEWNAGTYYLDGLQFNN